MKSRFRFPQKQHALSAAMSNPAGLSPGLLCILAFFPTQFDNRHIRIDLHDCRSRKRIRSRRCTGFCEAGITLPVSRRGSLVQGLWGW